MNAQDAFEAVFDRLGEIERRMAMQGAQGRVTDVDAAKGLFRMDLGKNSDGEDVKSPWMPYSQTAGALKVHTPPSVGQQMMMFCQGGDIEQGCGIPMTWSNQNATPSTSGTENTITFGPWRISLDGSELKITGPTVKITGDVEITGNVKITGNVDMNGGYVKADGKVIDETHTHTGVEPGGGNTGAPA